MVGLASVKILACNFTTTATFLTFPLLPLTLASLLLFLVCFCWTIIRYGRIVLYLKTKSEQQQRLGVSFVV